MSFLNQENIKQYKGAPLSVLYLLSSANQPLNASNISKLSGYTDKPITHALRRLIAEGWVLKTNYGYVLNQQFKERIPENTLPTRTLDPSVSTRNFSAIPKENGITLRTFSEGVRDSSIVDRNIIASNQIFSDIKEGNFSEPNRLISPPDRNNSKPGLESTEPISKNSDLNRNNSGDKPNNQVKDLDLLCLKKDLKELSSNKDQEQNKKVFKTKTKKFQAFKSKNLPPKDLKPILICPNIKSQINKPEETERTNQTFINPASSVMPLAEVMSAKWRLLKPYGIQPNKLTISIVGQPQITTKAIQMCIDEMGNDGLVGTQWSGHLIRKLQRIIKKTAKILVEKTSPINTPFHKISKSSQIIAAYIGPVSALPNGDRKAAIARVKRLQFFEDDWED